MSRKCGLLNSRLSFRGSGSKSLTQLLPDRRICDDFHSDGGDWFYKSHSSHSGSTIVLLHDASCILVDLYRHNSQNPAFIDEQIPRILNIRLSLRGSDRKSLV